MSQNPYPTSAGFGLRVHHAKRAFKKLAAKPWNRHPVHSRGFANCFEHFDGEAVVWTLMHAAQTDETLAHGIVCLAGRRWLLLEEWQRIYQGQILGIPLQPGLRWPPPALPRPAVACRAAVPRQRPLGTDY